MIMYLPTSPGLTRPELTRRQGTDAAVLIIFGASTTMIGAPTSRDPFPDSHLTTMLELVLLAPDLFFGAAMSMTGFSHRNEALAEGRDSAMAALMVNGADTASLSISYPRRKWIMCLWSLLSKEFTRTKQEKES